MIVADKIPKQGYEIKLVYPNLDNFSSVVDQDVKEAGIVFLISIAPEYREGKLIRICPEYHTGRPFKRTIEKTNDNIKNGNLKADYAVFVIADTLAIYTLMMYGMKYDDALKCVTQACYEWITKTARVRNSLDVKNIYILKWNAFIKKTKVETEKKCEQEIADTNHKKEKIINEEYAEEYNEIYIKRKAIIDTYYQNNINYFQRAVDKAVVLSNGPRIRKMLLNQYNRKLIDDLGTKDVLERCVVLSGIDEIIFEKIQRRNCRTILYPFSYSDGESAVLDCFEIIKPTWLKSIDIHFIFFGKKLDRFPEARNAEHTEENDSPNEREKKGSINNIGNQRTENNEHPFDGSSNIVHTQTPRLVMSSSQTFFQKPQNNSFALHKANSFLNSATDFDSLRKKKPQESGEISTFDREVAKWSDITSALLERYNDPVFVLALLGMIDQDESYDLSSNPTSPIIKNRFNEDTLLCPTDLSETLLNETANADESNSKKGFGN